jgi:glycosyltransferase involved in cell wall biosynthesis
MKNPTLTVVMPVFNGEKYLQEAIDSVLNQTFEDFELIIINDGSTDGSLEIINRNTDHRIRVIDNKDNYGIPRSRNVGIEEATSEFLTWCDCDDVSLPTRFKTQINFLKKHAEYGACGTWLARFGVKRPYVFKAYKDAELVKATLLFKPSMPNATVMLRMSKIREYNLRYNEYLQMSEDYDFILRCSMFFPLTNIRKVLYRYRASENSITKKFKAEESKIFDLVKVVYTEALEYLGVRPEERQLRTHRLITSEAAFDKFSDFIACYHWLCFLKQVNLQNQVYDQKAFNKVLADQFCFISKKASRFGFSTLKYYLKNSFDSFGYVSSFEVCKLLIRCSIRYDKFALRDYGLK